MRPLIFGVSLMIAQVSSPQCGQTPSSPSSGSTTSPSVNVPAAPNVLAVAVNGGPTNKAINQLFASVTLCVPGTSNCQSIGGILVDTGSVGLRVLASSVTLTLPAQTVSGGAPLAECLAFLDGSVAWGAVRTADLRLAGEQASAVPIQIIGTDTFPAIPSACSSRGTVEETQDDLQANGILGIGMPRQDCPPCSLTGSSNPGLYYACPTSSSCQVTTVPLASQVQNPVALFPTDNNGSALVLPPIPAGGAASAFGALIFGIGTQSNNALGSARVFTVDARGNFQTSFNGQSLSRSFIDSGSNGLFFLDSASTGMPACTNSTGFYCPPSVRSFTATQTGANGTSSAVSFSAGNVDSFNGAFSVFAETTGSAPASAGFDWGLPFFYGRTVFTAIQGAPTPAGPGPFWAH